LRGRLRDLGCDGHTVTGRGGEGLQARHAPHACLAHMWLYRAIIVGAHSSAPADSYRYTLQTLLMAPATWSQSLGVQNWFTPICTARSKRSAARGHISTE